MLFLRVLDNNLYNTGEVENLGFEIYSGFRIPDEYLDNQSFTVMRTCHGIGDWGIMSAMPRLLKQKYPNCEVYVPSAKLLNKLFGNTNQWSSWSNPYQNVNNVFDNNPYVNDFVDEIDGEVFHDHYRIYDKSNPDVPLLEQMLKFWQFEEEEYKDSTPEIYFCDGEKELG